MNRISEINTTVQLPTGINKSKPAVQLTTVEVDHLLGEYSELLNPTFKAWYASRFYILGRDNIAKLASQAKADGKNPAKLFSYLLKKGSV